MFRHFTVKHVALTVLCLALLPAATAKPAFAADATASAADTVEPLVAPPGTPLASPKPQPLTVLTPIELSSAPIRWNPDNRNDTKAGELEWMGGIDITSSQPEFGGWSGLAVSADGTSLVAISDEAHWLSAKILYDEKGRLSGLAEGEMAPLLGLKGEILARKAMGDAEGLTITGDDPAKGEAYVSFERMHRVWRYDLGAEGFAAWPSQIVTERRLGAMPSNSGIEAITTLLPVTGGDDQKLLALSEDARAAKGERKAFIIEGRKVTRLATKLIEPYKPTDIARLPNGDFLVLERSFSMLAGPGLELRLVDAADVKPDATLEGRVLLQANNTRTIDNMEGLAVRSGSEPDEVFVYLISDNNYNTTLQHTYLMMFRMELPQKPASVATPALAPASGVLTPPHSQAEGE
jgi:hypothetical protein